MVLRIDEDGPGAFVRPGEEPETVLAAAPDVVVALATGGISIEHALAAGELRGDSDVLRRCSLLGVRVRHRGFRRRPVADSHEEGQSAARVARLPRASATNFNDTAFNLCGARTSDDGRGLKT